MTSVSYEGKRLYPGAFVKYFGDEHADKVVSAELDHEATAINPRLVIPIALADANDIRRALAIGEGKLENLPAAKLGDSEDCVLARALSNGWSASVSSGETTISHPPNDGVSPVQLNLAVEALGKLGFVGVRANPSLYADERHYITIPHTWAMQEFVSWFDRGAFPELVLEGDQEGQEVVDKFNRWVADGISLSDIHNGHVHDQY